MGSVLHETSSNIWHTNKQFCGINESEIKFLLHRNTTYYDCIEKLLKLFTFKKQELSLRNTAVKRHGHISQMAQCWIAVAVAV